MKLDPNGGGRILPGSMQTACHGPLLAIPALLGGTMSTIGTIATIGSTVLGVAGALQQGEQAKTAAAYEAEQLRQRSNEELAIGQRRMFAARQQKENALSTLAARSAQSTGDTTDANVLNLGGEIENRGETQALMEFYRGQTASDRSKDAASAAIYKGKAAQQASYFKAGGTILDGFGSLASKYNKKGYGYGPQPVTY
jgi:hypothetical protein